MITVGLQAVTLLLGLFLFLVLFMNRNDKPRAWSEEEDRRITDRGRQLTFPLGCLLVGLAVLSALEMYL